MASLSCIRFILNEAFNFPDLLIETPRQVVAAACEQVRAPADKKTRHLHADPHDEKKDEIGQNRGRDDHAGSLFFHVPSSGKILVYDRPVFDELGRILEKIENHDEYPQGDQDSQGQQAQSYETAYAEGLAVVRPPVICLMIHGPSAFRIFQIYRY